MEKFGLKTLKSLKKNHVFQFIDQKKGQIHGNPVADGWAGTVMQKMFGIQQNLLLTCQPTDLHGNV